MSHRVLLVAALMLAGCGEEQQPPASSPTPAGTATATVIAGTPSRTPRARPARPAAPGRVLPAGAAASFARLDIGRSGVAVVPAGAGSARPEVIGSLRGGVAWSTAKVPIAMAVIAGGGGSASSQADLRAAITASDNAAAERLWSSLGPPAAAASLATEQLRGAGDRATSIESAKLRPEFTAFGQTGWHLADQARFTAGLPCSHAGRTVLDLMADVIPAQRWGLTAMDRRAAVKGGWGPGSRPGRPGPYLTRQMGIVELDGKPLAVAIATEADTHEAGIAAVDRIATWLRTNATTSGLPSTPRC